MKRAIAPRHLASQRRQLLCVLATAMLAGHVLSLQACGGSSTTDPGPDRPKVDTSTLVGTWTGYLDGGTAANSYGSSSLKLHLRADSTYTAEADNPRYCALIKTTWSVTGSQFTAVGTDCDGVGITFRAAIAPLRLNGTWTASSGRAGTFTVGRE